MASDNVPEETGLQISDFSGLVQRKTSLFLRNPSELWNAENVDSSVVGAVSKVKGYSQRGDDLVQPTTTSTTTSTITTSTSTSTTTT